MTPRRGGEDLGPQFRRQFADEAVWGRGDVAALDQAST
jgi:hypothetical protein